MKKLFSVRIDASEYELAEQVKVRNFMFLKKDCFYRGNYSNLYHGLLEESANNTIHVVVKIVNKEKLLANLQYNKDLMKSKLRSIKNQI